MNRTDLVAHPFSGQPTYRWIRASDKLPTYSQIRHLGDDQIVCKVKLFNPTGIGTWHLAAYDSDTRIAWGVCELQEREVGSVSMDELLAFRGQFGLPIERDLYYDKKTIKELTS